MVIVATSVGSIVVNVRYSQDRTGINQMMSNLRSINRQSQQMNRSLTQGFRQVSQQLQTANRQSTAMFRSMSTGVRDVNSGIRSMNTSMKTTNGALTSLVNGFKAFIGLQIFSFLRKEASNMLTWASDIVEVQNVVDVTFGEMGHVIDDFASRAIDGFGVAEVSAKQFAGTMGAMLKTSGIASNDVLVMSKQMVALAGDIASFYNLSTDEAMEKLRSGMSGQVQPLRQLGINLTIANLEAFALSQGITKSWQSMSQAEQTMLRYNYLMKNTSSVQGDFARTQGTWANQTRILKDNFQTLFAIFGKGFIVGILPIVKGLNVILVQLRKVGNAFVSLMEKITGKTFEEVNSIGGAVLPESMFTNATDGFEDVQDASKKTADKIKKDQKSLAGFDSIIQLSKPSDSSTSGLDGLGGVGGGASFGIDSSTYADDILSALDMVEGKEVKFDVTLGFKKAKKILNDVLDYLGIEPLNLDFDFKFIGQTAWNTVKNIIDTLKTVGLLVLEIGVKVWNDVDAVGIIEGVLGAYEKASKAIKSIVDALAPGLIAFYETALAPIVTWLGGAFKTIIAWLGEKFEQISTWFTANAPMISEFLTNVGKLIGWIWGILEPILSLLLKKVIEVADEVIAWVLKVFEFFMKTFNDIATFIEAVFAGDIETGLQAVTSIFENAKNFISDTFEGVKNILKSVIDFITGTFNSLLDSGLNIAKGLVDGFAKATGLNLDWIKDLLDKLGAFIKGAFALSWEAGLGIVSTSFNVFKYSIGEMIDGIKGIFEGLIKFLTGVFSGSWKSAWEGLKSIVGGIWTSMTSMLVGPLKAVVKAWNGIAGKVGNFTIPEWVPGVGGNKFSLPTLPEPSYQFADGGIVKGETWATVGERNRAEVIFPLENSAFIQSFGDMIAQKVGGVGGTSSTPQLNVNIERAFGDSRSMRDLAKSLIREMEMLGYRVGGAY